MESPDQRPDANKKVTAEQLLAESRQEVASPAQADKPEKVATDADAQALLLTRNLQAAQAPKSKIPFGLMLAVVTLIVFAIVASFLVGSLKPSSSNSNGTSSNSANQSNSPTGSTDNQINQDVQSCSNPATAISEC